MIDIILAMLSAISVYIIVEHIIFIKSKENERHNKPVDKRSKKKRTKPNVPKKILKGKVQYKGKSRGIKKKSQE